MTKSQRKRLAQNGLALLLMVVIGAAWSIQFVGTLYADSQQVETVKR